jgi:hypothetical protein
MNVNMLVLWNRYITTCDAGWFGESLKARHRNNVSWFMRL